MILDPFADMDHYLVGVEQTCRELRRTIAAARNGAVITEAGAPIGVQTGLEDDPVAAASLVSANAGKSETDVGMPPEKLDCVDMTSRKDISHTKKTTSSNGQLPPKRRYIKSWDKWIFDILKGGQEKKTSEIFDELHRTGKIHFKGEEQRRKMKTRVKKQLPFLAKKGMVGRTTKKYNAPWKWTGGATM
jgi:hypothetical protein